MSSNTVPANTEQPRPVQSHPVSASDLPANLVMFSAASGGIGLSTLCAMVAWELQRRGVHCALVDADIAHGGLDVLLGIEHEPGARFGDVRAPLGRIDGTSLDRRLPRWDGVGVLAFRPWDSNAPESWDVEAALRALGEVNDAVLVDAADARMAQSVPGLASHLHVVLVELSVLGLARAAAHLRGMVQDRIRVVAVAPRGAPKGTSSIGMSEAGEYLGCEICGFVRLSGRLCKDFLEGLGIRSIVTGSRRVFFLLADWIQKECRQADQHADIPVPSSRIGVLSHG